jgi:hypothetical protein
MRYNKFHYFILDRANKADAHQYCVREALHNDGIAWNDPTTVWPVAYPEATTLYDKHRIFIGMLANQRMKFWNHIAVRTVPYLCYDYYYDVCPPLF